MTIKTQINNDYVVAMKAKDVNAKSALGMMKTIITNAEKEAGATELTDAAILKMLAKAVKQREESMKIYSDAGRTELANKEADEICVLKRYLPALMTFEQIKTQLAAISETTEAPNATVKINKAIGIFNKTYPGHDMIDIKAAAAAIALG
jgi:uncharacterized protein YqeY